MITTVLTMLLAAGTPANSANEPPPLQCNLGPATQSLGGNDWLVYGCEDRHSVVVVATPPNPATPFVFIVTPDGNGGIELHGEGTGAKSATQPAYESLSSMSGAELAALFQLAQGASE